jgi:glycolate oxidase
MPEPDRSVLGRRDRIVRALSAIVPGEGVIATEREMRPYEADALTAYRALPMVVVLPETVQQVSQVLKYCHAEGIKVVPRGAGTSLSGGALPLVDGVLLGMAKFNRIREIDYDNRVVVAEPGVTNLAVSQADRLHHRRQRGGEFRRRALPEIRHDHQQRARLRDRADDRRDRADRRQASRFRRL